MKNVLLGSFLIFGISAFGQQGLVSTEAPYKKVIRTVNTFEKPVEVKKEVETDKNKTYAYLTRIVTSISEEDYKKSKALNY